MAIINGTSGADRIVGTTLDDVMDGGEGNDALNGGAGNDVIYGGNGRDTLTGDAGQDTLFGGADNDGFYGGGGDDQIFGEAGDDIMFGDTGNDLLDGGAGTNTMNGGAGNDTFVHRVGQGISTVVGGTGTDTVRIELASAQLTAAVRADLAALSTWMSQQLAAAGGNVATLAAQATGANLVLGALGLTVSTFEQATIVVDGQVVSLASLLNATPVAAASVTVAGDEDTALAGQIAATDPDNDALAYTLVQGPASGTVQLDAETGQYVYTPIADWSGADSFVVRVADASGATVEQQVDVTVAAAADTPLLAVHAATVVVSSELVGTDGNDVLTGGNGDDRILGGNGNDTLYGDGGARTFSVALDIAAALSDLDGSESLSIRVSDLPADGILSAGTANGDGSWTLTAAQLPGLRLSTATTADFNVSVTATALEVSGQVATVSAALPVLFDLGSGLGNDFISDGAGDDIVVAGAGNDVVLAGSGNDRYDGGAGFDTIDFSEATAAITANLSRGTAQGLGNDKMTGFEAVVGSRFGDNLTGSKFDNVLDGGAGNDRIVGDAGSDTIYGGAGNDKLYGGSGNDIIHDGEGNDIVSGGSGNDLIVAGAGNDTYIGGSGFDTLDYSGATSALNADLSKKTIDGFTKDKIDGIEKVIGSSFADTFKGSSRADVIDGGAGNDAIRGLGGIDVLTGGAGFDTFSFLKKDVVSGNMHLGVDVITDFAMGDVLDLADFAKGAKYRSIDDIIRLTESDAGTLVAAKINGQFVDVAMLNGFHADRASDLLAGGMLLV